MFFSCDPTDPISTDLEYFFLLVGELEIVHLILDNLCVNVQTELTKML
jgi:hypothetical protein